VVNKRKTSQETDGETYNYLIWQNV